MTLKVILNPAAGHGKASKCLGSLREILKNRQVDYEIFATKSPGHAVDIAQKLALHKCPKVVAVGGDGTISEVANGLIQTDSALGIIPVGTGNDLVRTLKIPTKLDRAVDVVLGGVYRQIDVGLEHDRIFTVTLGLGFPSEVAYQENQERVFKGSLAFFVSVYKALSKLKSNRMSLEMEGHSFEADLSLVMIQNAPYCGGGQLMAPGAKMDDGLLDVVTVDDISKLSLIYNFPKVYSGKHINHPKFKLYKTPWIKIYTGQPMRKMFDGDLYGTTPLEAKVLPQSLKVITPDLNRKPKTENRD